MRTQGNDVSLNEALPRDVISSGSRGGCVLASGRSWAWSGSHTALPLDEQHQAFRLMSGRHRSSERRPCKW